MMLNSNINKVSESNETRLMTKYANKTEQEDLIISQALKILESRLTNRETPSLTSPEDVENLLRLKLESEDSEIFACLFLDTKHRLIAYENLFNGTIDGCSVYPREVIKKVLAHNAGAVIFAHNHPSGVSEPSRQDKRITDKLKGALDSIDVKVLDHFIVGNGEMTSFLQRGLL